MTLIFEDTPLFLGSQSGSANVKPDNYTIAGSPAITDDGIASGFSLENYLKINKNIIVTQDNSFEIECKIKTDETGAFQSQSQFFYGINWNIYCGIESQNSRITFQITPNNYINTTEAPIILPNTEYTIKCFYKNNTIGYTLIGNGVNVTFTKNVSVTFTYNLVDMLIGKNSAASGLYVFKGSIDLNEFKIYVDENLVYQACSMIPYTLNEYGLKIPDPRYKDRVIDAYEQGLIEVYFK